MAMRLPSAWVVTAFAACLGAAVGGGVATLEAASRPWRAGDFKVNVARISGPSPQVDVPETQYAFGTVGVGATGSHEFVIRNTGVAALELTKGATSCTCTVSDFEEREGGSAAMRVVPPGESTKLRVQWRGKGEGGPFRQQAGVLTNDPRRPQIAFVVEGTVVPTYRAIPAALTLPKHSSGNSVQSTVRIFTFGSEPATVDSLTLSDEKTAPLISLASAPLDAADLAEQTGATGGLLITVDIRPGLPLGPLRQTIKVVFRMPEEIEVEIPVEGSVTGDIAIAGKAWDSSNEVISLGSVSSRTGREASLFITAKGPHRKTVMPVVREVVPESLRVVIGEGKEVGSGAVIRFPLLITIPSGSPPANHLCSPQAPAGKIVLETGHPDTPILTIPVCVTIDP